MNFHTLDGILRILHVTAGGISLIAGLLAIITTKGKKAHILTGKIYFWAMTAIFLTALPIAIPDKKIFFLCIAVFSYSLAFSGYRFTKLKKIGATSKLDVAAAILTGLSGMGMTGWGVWLLKYGFSPLSIILIVFGLFCIIMGWQDWNRLTGRKPQAKGSWMIGHLIRMQGSYIAAVTAFLVNNFTNLPPLVLWLGPTLVGTIGITYSARYYRKKFRLP